MGANARAITQPLRPVAIEAQDLVSEWEALPLEPDHEGFAGTTKDFPVSGASTRHVINGEELRNRFSTAGALIETVAVMRDDGSANGSISAS